MKSSSGYYRQGGKGGKGGEKYSKSKGKGGRNYNDYGVDYSHGYTVIQLLPTDDYVDAGLPVYLDDEYVEDDDVITDTGYDLSFCLPYPFGPSYGPYGPYGYGSSGYGPSGHYDPYDPYDGWSSSSSSSSDDTRDRKQRQLRGRRRNQQRRETEDKQATDDKGDKGDAGGVRLQSTIFCSWKHKWLNLTPIQNFFAAGERRQSR